MANTNTYDIVYCGEQGFVETSIWLEQRKKAMREHDRDLDFNIQDHHKHHVTITDGKPLKNFTWEK